MPIITPHPLNILAGSYVLANYIGLTFQFVLTRTKHLIAFVDSLIDNGIFFLLTQFLVTINHCLANLLRHSGVARCNGNIHQVCIFTRHHPYHSHQHTCSRTFIHLPFIRQIQLICHGNQIMLRHQNFKLGLHIRRTIRHRCNRVTLATNSHIDEIAWLFDFKSHTAHVLGRHHFRNDGTTHKDQQKDQQYRLPSATQHLQVILRVQNRFRLLGRTQTLFHKTL